MGKIFVAFWIKRRKKEPLLNKMGLIS
uniref:Uncharacterized protein n=1 Tax=Anguilla anguilla TaxID=7936 RepID=A0A0E9XYT7_ANGAN